MPVADLGDRKARKMVEILRRLREEHRNIARVLNALEHQLAIFDRGEQPDYDVLVAAADYFTGFPDRCHHPKEDLIFRKLKKEDPAAIESIEDLELEHEKMAGLAGHFREAVQNVLEEVEVPREAFDAVVRHFIRDQHRHMQMEEEHFFPLALRVLGPQDWAEIDSQVTKEDDPLFGSEASRSFEALLRQILKWEQEDEAEER
jgi:hemerythrin-like domain-containing protein